MIRCDIVLTRRLGLLVSPRPVTSESDRFTRRRETRTTTRWRFRCRLRTFIVRRIARRADVLVKFFARIQTARPPSPWRSPSGCTAKASCQPTHVCGMSSRADRVRPVRWPRRTSCACGCCGPPRAAPRRALTCWSQPGQRVRPGGVASGQPECAAGAQVGGSTSAGCTAIPIGRGCWRGCRAARAAARGSRQSAGGCPTPANNGTHPMATANVPYDHADQGRSRSVPGICSHVQQSRQRPWLPVRNSAAVPMSGFWARTRQSSQWIEGHPQRRDLASSTESEPSIDRYAVVGQCFGFMLGGRTPSSSPPGSRRPPAPARNEA
jgi:hypothetical protein